MVTQIENVVDSIKKISSERLDEIKKQVSEIAFKGSDQIELDSKLDSNEVKVTNVSNDINGIMDLFTSAISQTIRNLRIVQLPLNIKDFSIDNIKNHLNLDKSIEKLTQGLDFASLGINNIRVSYSTFVKTDLEGNISVGRMVKNIVKQLRDDSSTFIMLEIPTKVIKKDMMDSITSIVVALYIAFIEVKHNVEIVGSGKNAKFNNSIQEYLLNIGLVLTELDREFSRNNPNGYFKLASIETTNHFEAVFNPIVYGKTGLNEAFKNVKNYDMLFKADTPPPTDDNKSDNYQYIISVENKNIDVKKQKIDVNYRRVKTDIKEILFRSDSKRINLGINKIYYTEDTENLSDDKKQSLIEIRSISGLSGVESNENAYLVIKLKFKHGGIKSFSTVAKYLSEVPKQVKTEDTPTKKIEDNIKNQELIKSSKINN